MATNVREIMNTDIGIATTGVAGPDKSDGFAPGIVFVAISIGDHKICQSLLASSNASRKIMGITVEEYLKEHKRLIKVLEDAGKEGERQKQEVEHRRIGGMVLKLMEMDRQHK
jgi:hypothetical protein